MSLGTDDLGRSILASEPGRGTCDATGALVFGALPGILAVFGVGALASFSHGNYHEFVAAVNKRFSHRTNFCQLYVVEKLCQRFQ